MSTVLIHAAPADNAIKYELATQEADLRNVHDGNLIERGHQYELMDPLRRLVT